MKRAYGRRGASAIRTAWTWRRRLSSCAASTAAGSTRACTLTDEEWDLLRESNAVMLSIDYPLGMAAITSSARSALPSAASSASTCWARAATLNGRVGDVMIPNVVYDEHSQNTFLFRNCFTATDVKVAQLWYGLRQSESRHRARDDSAKPQLHARLLRGRLYRHRDGGRPFT